MPPIDWSAVLQRVAKSFNPVTSSPGAPFETGAFLDSFGPSLMPRTSMTQGFMTGLVVLTARASTAQVERITGIMVPSDAALTRKVGARAVVAGAGAAAAALPERDGEHLWRSGVRSGGRLLLAGALGGALYDVGTNLADRLPSARGIRPALMTGAAAAGVALWANRRLARRKKEIARWPVAQQNTLPHAVVAGTAVTAVGMGLARGYGFTRDALIGYLGPGPSKQVIARATNAALWALGATAAYHAGVGYIGRANEKVESGYATAPELPLVSGSPESFSAFEHLGQQGRRYVTDVVTSDLIEGVMDEPAVAHPIRTYVGFNSEPLYVTGRAEIALAELERTGAFDRTYLLLVAPTGTGWVDQTMIESAELLTRGDIATCCIQYGRYPSFLALQKVPLGRQQFRFLLWGVAQRLRERPPERRPKVLVFGESLGAWASSDVIMYQGIEGFDHYGIDRALWIGLPGLAKWSRNGMESGSSELVPEGTVGVFDRHEQLAALGDEERARLRAVILSHDNDPIAAIAPELLVQRPDWLAGERGRGVPRRRALAADRDVLADRRRRHERHGDRPRRVRILRPRLPG
ncbi:MAG: alpha/beta-hydrolase family protein [Acidimicrobiia bacterium]|nr:alpha/beta-hydrolase family protein [Acidimicrobiia bacterium]